ncbi:MAG: XdhC family protein [Saprospiraceae bacterium]
MLELLPILQKWIADNQSIAIATVTKTWGSSPRPVGSVLAVSGDGQLAGSVSGGCVEGAVLKEALQVIQNQQPKQLHYGISNDDAWTVGLMCGGELDVFVQPFPREAVQTLLLDALQYNKGGVLFSKMNEIHPIQQFFLPHNASMMQPPYLAFAERAYLERKSQIFEIAGEKWFAHVFPKKSQLLIIGAAHIAVELVRLAKLFDFETIVIDPRHTFAERTQFPEPPHQMLVDWPAEVLPNFPLDAYTYAVLLTHDPKIDDQALHILLKSNVGYIGALGSRKTHEKRITRLKEAGFNDEAIAKIHAPVGVDIHAHGAKEIALSIVAELIKIKNQYL